LFDDISLDYEVCNCNKVTVKQILNTIEENKVKTLGELQDLIKIGNGCRNCLLKEADQGKLKKKIYCKDILDRYKKRGN